MYTFHQQHILKILEFKSDAVSVVGFFLVNIKINKLLLNKILS